MLSPGSWGTTLFPSFLGVTHYQEPGSSHQASPPRSIATSIVGPLDPFCPVHSHSVGIQSTFTAMHRQLTNVCPQSEPPPSPLQSHFPLSSFPPIPLPQNGLPSNCCAYPRPRARQFLWTHIIYMSAWLPPSPHFKFLSQKHILELGSTAQQLRVQLTCLHFNPDHTDVSCTPSSK